LNTKVEQMAFKDPQRRKEWFREYRARKREEAAKEEAARVEQSEEQHMENRTVRPLEEEQEVKPPRHRLDVILEEIDPELGSFHCNMRPELVRGDPNPHGWMR